MNPVMPSHLEMRVATQGDAAVLAALQAEMDDDAPDHASTIDAALMIGVLAEMERYPDFNAYLLLEHGTPVGSFSLMIFCSPTHQGASQALLDAVVVTNARRGNGLGELMIKRAMDLASAAGCYKMMLSSNLKRVAAHRFYQQLGFRQHGISFSATLDPHVMSEQSRREQNLQ